MFDPSGFTGTDGFLVFKGTSFRKVFLYALMALLLVVALMILGDKIGYNRGAFESLSLP